MTTRRFAIFAVLAAALQFSADRVPLERFQESEAERDARLVAGLECGALDAASRRSCESDLAERFESGAAEPALVLRSHCTRFLGSWSRPPEPPAACVERFGGWVAATGGSTGRAVSAGPPGGS